MTLQAQRASATCKRHTYQIQLLDPRKIPAAEALQEGQQLRLAEPDAAEVDFLAIKRYQATAHHDASHACHR